MTSYSASPLWESLQYTVEMKYSSFHTFEAHLQDNVLNDSVLTKFDTNIIDCDALRHLQYLTVHLHYYTLEFQHDQFIREANYVHYNFLLCHWEHMMPLLFSIPARKMFAVNYQYAGSVSYSLANGPKIMIKLLRIVDKSGESVCKELAVLSKTKDKRARLLKALEKDGVNVAFPIQFFV